ncbi:hypothetical protein [Agrobacterium pusense]|uniref:hypothetical protein n=1 Tax=Agrobacterium pusense TaxID=648995 RepID=UPI0005138A3E|nr:hypothetical protein [Agrobacterium pusense]ANV24461.1 hypothetical protein BA939_11295 [Rhizobium sp. S41]KGE81457.1 hypothetical protein LW14_17585 [Rhizobium sp. H41]QWW74120.1 hypothetical protein KP800_01010 [Agrobacterium pusense]
MDVLERAEFEVKTFDRPSKESGLKLIAEVACLRQLLSEAEKRESEARAAALEEAAKVAEAEYKRHCTGSGFDSQPARSTAHRILEALKALQSEDR